MIQQIILLPMSNEPMTPEGAKVMLGVFIVLNIVWGISLIIQLFNFIKCKIKNESYYYSDIPMFHEIMNMGMGIIWGVITLVFLGILVSNQL